MAGELLALGEVVAQADAARGTAPERLALDQAMRASLLCALLGVEREGWVWPFRASDASRPRALLGALFDPLDGTAQLGTLAGAADLDPMDPGPSHSVLPATLAACILAEDDALIASGVTAGIEAAWRLRRAVTGARPGIGFHSPGVYGAIAAAAAGARTLQLDAGQCANAIAIALTRASGLAINSAASMIGMTHFGWGAAHGLEAALLAGEGWDASHDIEKALGSLFGAGSVDLAAVTRDGPAAASALVFKRYPCNIYLNLLVAMLDEVPGGPVDRIAVTLPWVPHLDCPRPRDIRQARNSAQAAAAIAGAGDTSYAAFSGPAGPWRPAPAVERLLERIELVMDKAAPTRLNDASVGVHAWRGDALVLDATRPMRELGGWGVEHARRLVGAGDPHGGVDALYGGSVAQAWRHVKKRRLASAAAQD